ncbi:MAG: calcium-binding protein [Sphingomicrobium sp.]
MKTILLGVAAAAVFATVAVAQVRIPSPQAANTTTRAEVTAKVQQHFARVDANHDGAITQDELQAVGKARPNRMGAARNGGGFFERLDSNRDGQVTRGEFDAARAARAQQRAGGQERRGEGMFARLDTNRDGAITRAEFDAARQQRGERNGAGQHAGMHMAGFGAHMFTMADANKDGRVTLQEATATALQHFDTADANKDGQVTPQERKQMHQQMRGHMQHKG